nr:MAG TPA: large terminase [Caudoviricetes sp.]
MKWSKLSNKQMQLLTWWMPESPFSKSNGVIAEGAVRSGKTIVGSFSFMLWSMSVFKNSQLAICGKTIGSLRRNVLTPLKEILVNRGYSVIERKGENYMIVSKGKTSNVYYFFGGRDERSQDLVQGITLAGVFFDEVALMPQSFVEQCMARCSISGAKLWFNCNPSSPSHWFYITHVLKWQERKYLRIHFNIEDNLSLSEDTIERYKSMFQGIFYKRFILGEWAAADGVVYDCFDVNKNTYTEESRDAVLPISIRENDAANGGRAIYGCDYGVYNPCVYLEGYKFRKNGDRTPYFYIDKEYYYDGRKSMKQKTDEEYANDFVSFADGKDIRYVIVDPSASSFIMSLRRKGMPTLKARNDVEDGIKMVYALMSTGHILINKDKCPKLIQELGLYIWDEKKAEKGKEEVVKQNDHCCDALRYLVASVTNSYEVM